MMKRYYSRRHNLHLINFRYLYPQIKDEYSTMCEDLGLSREDQADHNKLYKHQVAYTVLETIRSFKGAGKPVITIGSSDLTHDGKHLNPDKNWNSELKKAMNIVCSLVPTLKILYLDDFDEFVGDLEDKRGEVVDIIEIIKKDSKKTVNFKKAREISNKHGLKFLSETYFNQIKNKMILINA